MLGGWPPRNDNDNDRDPAMRSRALGEQRLSREPSSRSAVHGCHADGGGDRRMGALLLFGVLVGVLSWLPGPAVAAPLILEVFRISTVLGSNS